MTVRNLIDYALDFPNLVESPEKLDRPSFRTLARVSLLSFVPAVIERAAESFLKLIPSNAAIRTCYNPCDSALRVEGKSWLLRTDQNTT